MVNPFPISNVIIWVGQEFDNDSLCPAPRGPFTLKKSNCTANSLGGLLEQSKEELVLLIHLTADDTLSKQKVKKSF